MVIKIKYFTMLVALLLVSCAIAKPLSQSPVDAYIPELEIQYLKNGNWISVAGHSGDEFEVGDVKKYRVKAHNRMKNCQFTYMDGDKHFTQDCKRKSWIELNLGVYYAGHPTIVSMSVASKKVGIQVGHLYPFLGTKRNTLPVTLNCPNLNTHRNITSCSRPATYSLRMEVKNPLETDAKLMYQYSCSSGEGDSQVHDLPGGGFMEFNLDSSSPTYCAVGYALKGGSSADEKFSHQVHVRFYDPRYIPLSSPRITKVKQGYNVCASEDYKLYSINDRDMQTNIFTGRCFHVNSDKVDVIVWDEIGRVGRGTSDER